VRGCSVTTLVGDQNVDVKAPCASCTTTTGPQAKPFVPPPPAVSTKIQTVADVKPSEPSVKPGKEKIQIKDLLSDPIEEKKPSSLAIPPVAAATHHIIVGSSTKAPIGDSGLEIKSTDLQAYFIKDTMTDGSTLLPNQRFVQTWTLRNPGPYAWPAGCSVRYVGGDNMLNVDDNHPSSAADIAKATESNVTDRPIQPDEEFSFRVVMKAPKREGITISYWRLKAADGTPFGHRLWCHVNVLTAPSPTRAAPATLEPVGRPGNHDAFLRLFLDEHTERVRKMNEETAARFQNLKRVQQEAMSRIQANAERRKTLMEQVHNHHMAHQIARLRHARNVTPNGQSQSGDEQKPNSGLKLEEPQAETLTSDQPKRVKIEEVKTEEHAAPIAEKAVPEIAPPSSPAAETTSTDAETATAASEESEIFEDAETVSLVDSDLDDEPFLTDEEYDILDASDEEAA
jgi:next-to-BRCA1 protein 1